MSFIPHFLDFACFPNYIFTFLLPGPPILLPTSSVADHMYAQVTLFGYSTDLVELLSNCSKEFGNKLRDKIARMLGDAEIDRYEEGTKRRADQRTGGSTAKYQQARVRQGFA